MYKLLNISQGKKKEKKDFYQFCINSLFIEISMSFVFILRTKTSFDFSIYELEIV